MAGKNPYNSMKESLNTLATNMGGVLPDKKYSSPKDEMAEALNVIATAGGGGGAMPEVIKVATLTVPFSIGSPASGTSGSLVDNKTIGELIGDKRIINAFWKATAGENHIAYIYLLSNAEDALGFVNNGVKYDILLDGARDGFSACNSMSSGSIYRHTDTSQAVDVYLDVYVVVI